jgi:hypothetical protein
MTPQHRRGDAKATAFEVSGDNVWVLRLIEQSPDRDRLSGLVLWRAGCADRFSISDNYVDRGARRSMIPAPKFAYQQQTAAGAALIAKV